MVASSMIISAKVGMVVRRRPTADRKILNITAEFPEPF
jgi:hypothetical protein